MSDQPLEVADVFRQHGQEFLERWGDALSRQQLKAFRDIRACRTAALGVEDNSAIRARGAGVSALEQALTAAHSDQT